MLHKLLATAIVKRALFASISLGAHAALASALTFGPSAHPATSASLSAAEIDVSIEAPAPPPAPEIAPPPQDDPLDNHAAAQALHHPHTHAYPVPKDHDARDHDPSLQHAPVTPVAPAVSEPNEAPAVATSDTPAPRFKMKLGGASSATGIVGAPAGGARAHDDESAATLGEEEVSEPARLLARAPAVYPAAAREQEIEADVPLEIVVDTRGAVTEARLLRAAGRGFDEAALSAVRGYRFSPAKKDGRLVRARMRWTVQFKLQ
jgi:protein TonB